MHFLNFQSIASVKSGGGWLGFCGTALLGSILLIILIKLRSRFFSSVWNVFKYSYFSLIVAFFLFIYISYNLNGTMPLGRHPGYWYTLLFTLTMSIFGIRRMYKRPTGYVIRQTIALLAIQTVFLCILPLYVLPWLGDNGYFNAWIMHNVFPNHSYWRSFGFILAWPLFMANLASGQPSSFWLIVSLIQTFVVIPVLVFFWGKGSYCGWICSCGGLAETLGDEYRMKTPHGLYAKRMENAGQLILWFAFIATLVSLCTPLFPFRFSAQSQFLEKTYTLAVDIVCSGVIGMGFYFFLSGRVWCRFFCPLAGLMHLYARFSHFRIMANKNRCISCAICTASCHMGIDVMNYANKGIPMNDVECVRCSACITQCPLQVLTFGKTGLWDIDNKKCKTRHFPLARGWKSGLPKNQIEMLLREEADQRDRKIDLS
jgi:polyferredoxin